MLFIQALLSIKQKLYISRSAPLIKLPRMHRRCSQMVFEASSILMQYMIITQLIIQVRVFIMVGRFNASIPFLRQCHGSPVKFKLPRAHLYCKILCFCCHYKQNKYIKSSFIKMPYIKLPLVDNIVPLLNLQLLFKV